MSLTAEKNRLSFSENYKSYFQSAHARTCFNLQHALGLIFDESYY